MKYLHSLKSANICIKCNRQLMTPEAKHYFNKCTDCVSLETRGIQTITEYNQSLIK